MSKRWRLLDTGALPGATNMALDEILLDARSRDLSPNTLRYLQFSPHCALVGYHQAVEQELRVEFCRANGIEINRRITGGGALYWDESQLGWEIYAEREAFPQAADVAGLYRTLCQGVISGLGRLGVAAAFRPRNDIEVDGRKISGTGGTGCGRAFLFQGSLLVDFDVDTMLGALNIPTEKLRDKEIASIRERVVSLSALLGAAPPIGEIKAALAAGFAEVLDIDLAPAPLNADEEALLAARLPQFQGQAWVYGTRTPRYAWGSGQAIQRAPGGVLRASLLLEGNPPRIREAFITGDFFAQPRRAILDLEASLKGVPAAAEDIGRAVEQFFATYQPSIAGVAADDFVRVLCQALA